MYLYLLAALSSVQREPIELHAGARLHIRLATPVGTYASAKGTPVRAFLIAPVIRNGVTLLPAGATLSGEVKSVRKVGMGLLHETSSLGLEFNRIDLPDGGTLPLNSRMSQVDNSRDTVSRSGLIRAGRSTASVSYRVCGYIKTALMWEFHARLAFWAIKTLIVQLPEPEIYYPPGAEFTLVSTAPVRLDPTPASPEQQELLSPQDSSDLEELVGRMPRRAYVPLSRRPSDFVNTGFIGSRESIAAAFTAAGWTQPRASSFHSHLFGATQLATGAGFHELPMSPQLLNDAEPDMSWEKNLNDFSKRHHIRIWKQPGNWHGQPVWAGAATQDIDLAYMRPGQKLTHRIAEDVDDEREKIVDDLAFTSCVERVNWFQRPGFPRSTWNATGDRMLTDGRMALIQVKPCPSPRLSTEIIGPVRVLAMHGNRWQRLARREILSMRSDLLRANIYWRSAEGVRFGVIALRNRKRRIEAENLRPLQVSP